MFEPCRGSFDAEQGHPFVQSLADRPEGTQATQRQEDVNQRRERTA